MVKVLITSVGSLVGQNILDSLEHRRNQLSIIGLNSVAANQRVFRCDRAYLVPPVEEINEYTPRFLNIVRNESPDLILAGRDADVLFLAKFVEDFPEFSRAFPFASSQMAEMTIDKYQSYLFAKKHQIPFAESFLFQGFMDRDALFAFVQKVRFPIVIKPRKGFASIGVFYIDNHDQLNSWMKKGEEFFCQEFLGDLEPFEKHKHITQLGVPHFFQIPDHKHISAQSVIGPDGQCLRSIITILNMIVGRAESLELFKDPLAESFVESCALKYGNLGWKGFLNFQFKKDLAGNWKIYEINPRMLGASSARLLMGYDEIGLMFSSFYPELGFPDSSLPEFRKGIILKSLVDYYIETDLINRFTENGEY